ncbi:MAG: hypothetical protein KBD21_01615 [Candidatus Pacebacteria bacterium]|nr:hypothetical protein [Candidatus Paceibacterota bacterium]
MGFKNFFAFNLQKIILTLLLIIFAPLPFFVFVMAGWAPPILILLFIPSLIHTSTNALLTIALGILFFIIHALFAYLISCIINWILGKISQEKSFQRVTISILAIILVAISFSNIYGIGDVGGGFHRPNIYEIFFQWTKS